MVWWTKLQAIRVLELVQLPLDADAITSALTSGVERGARSIDVFLTAPAKGSDDVDCETPSRVGRWPVLRVQPGHDYSVVLLSGEWLRLTTHYADRTIVCSENDLCECCAFVPGRSYWYLPGLLGPQRRPCILELSSTASADLEERAKFDGGSVRAGLITTLIRKTSRAPIRCDIGGFDAKTATFAFSVWASYVMALFGLPAFRPGELVDAYSARVQPLVVERSKIGALRLKSRAERGVRSR